MLVLVGQRVLDLAVAHAQVLARRGVGAIGVVHVIFHGLGELALIAGRSGDGIDDVAAFFVHDDAACPDGEFRIAHDLPSLSSKWICAARVNSSVLPDRKAGSFIGSGLPRWEFKTDWKSPARTTNGAACAPS